MASFNNLQSVQNQAAHQIIHGNVNFYTDSAVSAKRQRFLNDGSDANRDLDDAILTSLAFPQMFERRSNIEAPHTQTCRWIFDLEDYKTWRAQKSGLLWIKGKPGSGKSTLMSHIYRQIYCENPSDSNDRGVYLEFFFNARGVALQRSPLGMLRALLSQLFCQHPPIRDVLREPFQVKCASLGWGENSIVWQWQRPELELLFEDVVLAAAKTRQVNVLIDALDEAGERDAREIARCFHRTNDRTTDAGATAKICISCRHYPIPSTIQSIEIYVEEHDQADIAGYTRDYISIDDLPDGKGWHHLINYLIDQAHGIFQWTRLVVPMVKKQIDDGDSPDDVREWLRTVPEELESVYRHILENVIDHRHRMKSYRLFQWSCLSARPLSMSEMQCALAQPDYLRPFRSKSQQIGSSIQRGEITGPRVRSWSGGLLEIVETTTNLEFQMTDFGRGLSARGWRWVTKESPYQTIQVIHQSVTDYLVSGGLSFLASLNDYLEGGNEDCHGTLYRSCLGYISSAKEIKDWQTKSSDPKIWTQLREATQQAFPLIEYAIQYVLFHANAARGHRGQDLTKEYQALRQAIPIWATMNANMDPILSYPRHGSLYDGYSSRNMTRRVSFKYVRRGSTALHVAALADFRDLAEHLLEYVTDITVDETDLDGGSALHYAAAKGHVEIARTLISAGAVLDLESENLVTPLEVAARNGHAQFLSWLLSQDAQLTASSENALHIAAARGDTTIVKACVDAGVNVDARGLGGSTTLQVASARGHTAVARLLIDAGADVNARGGWRGNALEAASRHGGTEIVRLLVNAGADVNAPGARYGSALQVALLHSSLEAVRLLIDAGADVNARGGWYGNALHVASCYGRKEVVRLLVDAGADIRTHGEDALQAALEMDYTDIVQILKDAGANWDETN